MASQLALLSAAADGQCDEDDDASGAHLEFHVLTSRTTPFVFVRTALCWVWAFIWANRDVDLGDGFNGDGFNGDGDEQVGDVDSLASTYLRRACTLTGLLVGEVTEAAAAAEMGVVARAVVARAVEVAIRASAWHPASAIDSLPVAAGGRGPSTSAGRAHNTSSSGLGFGRVHDTSLLSTFQ